MASCTDLHKISSTNDHRPILKATPAPIFSSKKFVEPFTRLKNRANLFRRKNYSSQNDISNPRTSLPADHLIPSLTNQNAHLKRSNSMICPQEQLQTFFKTCQKQRNSLCLKINDCQQEESSTDDYRFLKSSSTRFWKKKMTNITEQIDDEDILSLEKKISTSTMTGQSLNNLDECSSSTSSEDKCIQTALEHSSDIVRHHSSTSLSSTSTSIQTDSLENKPKLIPQWTHILPEEQTCIYWVNYLGSTSIKISHENPSILPTYAINRLKQTTQYARLLPIIGLSISSRGVEFLKHSKEKVVICFHDIKSIHCACQDRDLRYFAYVTREQRLINDTNRSIVNDDYHNYCHVFVVKNEQMSTEILLNFGKAFERAYRQHQSKQINSSATSSSSSIDERRVFI